MNWCVKCRQRSRNGLREIRGRKRPKSGR